MSSLLTSRGLFMDRDDLELVVIEFSERVRQDPGLRPALNRLIGNHWAMAEEAALRFLGNSLFGDGITNIEADLLALVTRLLTDTDVERLEEILLDCALLCLPLHSAARVSAVAEEFGRALKAIIALEGVARQRLLLRTHALLASGALLNGL